MRRTVTTASGTLLLTGVAMVFSGCSAAADPPSVEQAATIIERALASRSDDMDVVVLASERTAKADYNELLQSLRKALVLNLPAGTDPRLVERQESSARDNADRIWREMNSDNLRWFRYRRIGEAWRLDQAPFKGEETMPSQISRSSVFTPSPTPTYTTIDYEAKRVTIGGPDRGFARPNWLDPRAGQVQWENSVRMFLSTATGSNVERGQQKKPEFVAVMRRHASEVSGKLPWVFQVESDPAGGTRFTGSFANLAQPSMEITFEDANFTRISRAILREATTGRTRIDRTASRFDADGVPHRVEESNFDANGNLETKRVFEVISASFTPGTEQGLRELHPQVPDGFAISDQRAR